MEDIKQKKFRVFLPEPAAGVGHPTPVALSFHLPVHASFWPSNILDAALNEPTTTPYVFNAAWLRSAECLLVVIYKKLCSAVYGRPRGIQ